jgi:hypothetical protein
MDTSYKKKLTAEITDYVNQELAVIEEKFSKKPLRPVDLFIQPDSLRLRPVGYQLLILDFEPHSFPLKRKLTAGELLKISKNMNSPYYLTASSLAVFGDECSVMLKLAGDVTSWLDLFP